MLDENRGSKYCDRCPEIETVPWVGLLFRGHQPIPTIPEAVQRYIFRRWRRQPCLEWLQQIPEATSQQEQQF